MVALVTALVTAIGSAAVAGISEPHVFRRVDRPSYVYDAAFNNAVARSVETSASPAADRAPTLRPAATLGIAPSPFVLVVAAEGGSGVGTSLEPMWAQAPNNGFLGGWSTTETLQPGTLIDRYGAETGRFFSPAGTDLAARALPTGAGPLNGYEVLKAFDVQGGIVGPAFGQPGLGIQYMSPQTVADLIEGGFIKPVAP
ncbi:MAG: TNT domain-containing protein [Acidimicrobiales bacterium]